MSLHEAEAIILRHYPLSEADRLIVLLTREVGLLRGVVRGAKKPTSRLGACLEPLNHAIVQYYLREGADLARIIQCEIVYSFLGRVRSLDRVCGFTYFAELAQEMSQENNPNPVVFRLLLASLRSGEQLGVNNQLLRYFELWMLRLSGLLPDYDYCSNCGLCVKQKGFYAWLEGGQGRCEACSGSRGLKVGPEAAAILHRLQRLPPEVFAALHWSEQASRELEDLSRSLLDWHLERKLKSFRVLQEVLEGK